MAVTGDVPATQDEQDDGWVIVEDAVPEPERVRHRETVFTIGNGAQCVRGSFEEGLAGEDPATFLHGVWDDEPVGMSELANLPRWIGVDVWVDGERVSLRRGVVEDYHRRLDLRTGLLTRTARWRANDEAPAVTLAFERFVDASRAGGSAVRVSVTADADARVRLRAPLDSHVENTGRVHFDHVGQTSDEWAASLRVRTRATTIEVAQAAVVTLQGAGSKAWGSDADGAPAVEHECELTAGTTAVLTKYVATIASVSSADPVGEAFGLARELADAGWAAVLAGSSAVWADRWAASDIVVDGDPEAQIALRYNLFQLQIAAPRFTDRASIGAKTLSGFGYRHHVFWDTESFMLPLFVHTEPEVARNMLAYRWHGLAGARAKAAANGYRGAQYPWESAGEGVEVTPTWVPDLNDRTKLVRIWTGDIEIHITADIAFGVLQYWGATGDDDFMRDMGAEMVLDGARFWASAATLEKDGRYHFREVIGPDEYHDHVDDNAYTNYFARWHLRAAEDVWRWLSDKHPQRAAELGEALAIDDEARASWKTVAAGMFLPLDEKTGLVEQFEGYFALPDADIELLRSPERTESMQQIDGIEGCARTQVLKQPDVMMLQYLLSDEFTSAQLRANYAYYDPRTDHEFGSSLGPSISAVMACRAGDSERGYDHFLRAARADLLDVRHNASDGIHGASAGGMWQAAVYGFAGLRLTADGFSTHPQLPASWKSLTFTFTHRGERHTVTVTNEPEPTERTPAGPRGEDSNRA
ncbi:glycoside hydrolase family 65 protein [Nigerium massiliense]|uniref:glycoside hydrolase family 65 protein n=1 Tax=Nigerium massiliense TaxID=1522317 RepID=UPI000693A9F6|nr:glycosyl hydrolase family 65 protein [Nigerium massiliense]